MALDRQDIEKKDFPIGRRGYEPEAVDSHLRLLADEVDTLRRSSRTRTETLASAASEQVRVIVEAAESSAASIQREADEAAAAIRSEADEEASRTRGDAADQARQHVSQVSEATTTMLQRVDAMESELGALVESLRTGTNRLNADLSLLQGNVGELSAATSGRGASATPAYEAPPAYDPAAEADVLEPVAPPEPVPAPEPIEPMTPEAGLSSDPETSFSPEPAADQFDHQHAELDQFGQVDPEPADAGPAFDHEGATQRFDQPLAPAPDPEPTHVDQASEFTGGLTPVPEPEPGLSLAPEPSVEPAAPPFAAEPAAAPSGDGDDSEGARLIALNMALNGTPREETDRYLAENFNLADRAALLDEIYARVG